MTAPPRRSEPADSEEAAIKHIVRGGVLAFLMLTLARTWADPDLWGHVRFGADILRDGLPRVDTYSFTSDIAWTNHEWLAEVLMYLAWAVGGNAGLIALKIAVALSTLAVILIAIRPATPSQVARDLLVFVAIAGFWARVFVVRPQIFSLVLFAILLWVLLSIERGYRQRMWWLVGVFTFWVNAHGGWLVGIGTLGVWTGATLVWRRSSTAPPKTAIAAAAVGLAATLVNPYGVGMWAFLGETVSFERADINDWQPLYRSGPEVIVPWALTAGITIFVLAQRIRSVPVPHLLIVLALAAGSFRVNRLDAFFALAVVMLLAPQFSDAGAAKEVRPLWTRRTIGAAAAALLVGAILMVRGRDSLLCVRMDGPWMPEREAGLLIKERRLEGRLLTWFDWGQYAIWHYSPYLKVSVDGRRETVYSAGFIAKHLQLYFEPDSAMEFLQSLNADYAWLPAGLPLVKTLDEQGWLRIYSGPVSVVLARNRQISPAPQAPAPQSCFPGP